MNRGNLSQMLQQVIMNNTAPTTTITSDGNGNTKESTKIVWDGGMPERGDLGERLDDYDYPTAEQWGGTTFGQPTGNADAISNGFGNMWDGVSGAMNDFTQSPTGSMIAGGVGDAVDWWKSIDPPKSWDADHPGLDANGNPYYPAHNYRPGPNGDGDGPTKGGLGRKVDYAKKQMDKADPYDLDPYNILGGGTPPEEETADEKKARINEKFKNVIKEVGPDGKDYSKKETEEGVKKSIEKAAGNYQDEMLTRYGDYDFAVKASEERKERLKRTNRVVMQGFMLDVLSQAMGKKVGSQNYVENALKALEVDFKLSNEDQIQEITRALYFRPDGTYDPPASKDEAFQALTMMGLTTDDAAAISGSVSESVEYYVKDSSNPSGYRVTRVKPGRDEEYTTNAVLADKKYGIDTSTLQTQAQRDKAIKDSFDLFYKQFPREDGFFVNEKQLVNTISNTGTIADEDVSRVDQNDLHRLWSWVDNGIINKSHVIKVGPEVDLNEIDNLYGSKTVHVVLQENEKGSLQIYFRNGTQ